MQGGAKTLRAYIETPLPSPIHTYFTSHTPSIPLTHDVRPPPAPRPRRPDVFTSRQCFFFKRALGAFCAISAFANIVVV